MITFVLIAIGVIALLIWANISKSNKLKELKENYDNALRGTDRKTALDAGRAYYSALRKDSKLTIYDEQAIINDLSAMKTTRYAPYYK